MDWVAANGGLPTESDYPYEVKQGKCKPDKVRNHVVKIRGRKDVDGNNEAALEVAVAQPRFNLSVEKKYRRSSINGFIGFIGKFLGKK
jgi:hypothetical protein